MKSGLLDGLLDARSSRLIVSPKARADRTSFSRTRLRLRWAGSTTSPTARPPTKHMQRARTIVPPYVPMSVPKRDADLLKTYSVSLARLTPSIPSKTAVVLYVDNEVFYWDVVIFEVVSVARGFVGS